MTNKLTTNGLSGCSSYLKLADMFALSMAVTFGYLLQANNIKKVKSEMSTKNLLKQIPRDVFELYKGKNIDH